MLPVPDLGQIIRAHQPGETRGWKGFPEGRQRIGGVTGAQILLDRRDQNAGMAGDRLGALDSLNQRRHAFARFKWVLRANQPPNLI